MKNADDAIRAWFDMARSTIEGQGEYRLPMAIWQSRGGKFTVEALALDTQMQVLRCINTIDGGDCESMVFGLDMSSLPGQGLEFDDFVLVYEWRRERAEPLRNQLHVGVVNYRKGQQPIVREIDWDNAYWKGGHAFNIVKHFVPMRVRVQRTEAAR